jgi:long-chain fatty acid transport protein
MLFNILAPAVMEEHVTFGFTRAVGTDMEFDVSALYAPKSEVSGPNTLDAPDQQKITLEMTQWELAFNWAWKF